jgi:hypothetical protein
MATRFALVNGRPCFVGVVFAVVMIVSVIVAFLVPDDFAAVVDAVAVPFVVIAVKVGNGVAGVTDVDAQSSCFAEVRLECCAEVMKSDLNLVVLV